MDSLWRDVFSGPKTKLMSSRARTMKRGSLSNVSKKPQNSRNVEFTGGSHTPTSFLNAEWQQCVIFLRVVCGVSIKVEFSAFT